MSWTLKQSISCNFLKFEIEIVYTILLIWPLTCKDIRSFWNPFIAIFKLSCVCFGSYYSNGSTNKPTNEYELQIFHKYLDYKYSFPALLTYLCLGTLILESLYLWAGILPQLPLGTPHGPHGSMINGFQIHSMNSSYIFFHIESL